LSLYEIARLFFLFANIASKRNLHAVEKGHFCSNHHILPENENKWFYLGRKKILSTENHVRPNRDDSDHVLINTIDVDQMEMQQVTRYKISQNPVGCIQISAGHEYIR
jgi:hypothetical protein